MMEQITSQAVMWRAVAGVLGVLLLIVVLLIWKRKKVSLKPAIVGAITYVVFAQVLEGIPKLIFFTSDTDLTEYVWTHAWAYVLIGCLMAGIFEETGRFVAFRFFLKKYQDRKDAITYGIGHGGIEAILVLGISGISSIALAAAVNDGSLAQSLSGISTGQLKSVEMQITALAGYGVGRMLLEVCERCIAMTLHIALSVVVFKAVQENQKRYLWIAMLLHAVFDIPAALCQCGVIGMGVAEIWLFVSVLVCVWYAKKVYGTLEEKA